MSFTCPFQLYGTLFARELLVANRVLHTSFLLASCTFQLQLLRVLLVRDVGDKRELHESDNGSKLARILGHWSRGIK